MTEKSKLALAKDILSRHKELEDMKLILYGTEIKYKDCYTIVDRIEGLDVRLYVQEEDGGLSNYIKIPLQDLLPYLN
ncbi:hypothetical protein V1498_02815 [Peribacillus sp. SCS-26]|uniref:hypothetical protein n=1 Tax=Paraperibacillus marinus TaxID=3115295 RepID=UPI003905BE44